MPHSDHDTRLCGVPLLFDHETKLSGFVLLLVAISYTKRVPLWEARDAHPVVVQIDSKTVDHGVGELLIAIPNGPRLAVLEASLLQRAVGRECRVRRFVQHGAEQSGIQSAQEECGRSAVGL